MIVVLVAWLATAGAATPWRDAVADLDDGASASEALQRLARIGQRRKVLPWDFHLAAAKAWIVWVVHEGVWRERTDAVAAALDALSIVHAMRQAEVRRDPQAFLASREQEAAMVAALVDAVSASEALRPVTRERLRHVAEGYGVDASVLIIPPPEPPPVDPLCEDLVAQLAAEAPLEALHAGPAEPPDGRRPTDETLEGFDACWLVGGASTWSCLGPSHEDEPGAVSALLGLARRVQACDALADWHGRDEVVDGHPGFSARGIEVAGRWTLSLAVVRDEAWRVALWLRAPRSDDGETP